MVRTCLTSVVFHRHSDCTSPRVHSFSTGSTTLALAPLFDVALLIAAEASFPASLYAFDFDL